MPSSFGKRNLSKNTAESAEEYSKSKDDFLFRWRDFPVHVEGSGELVRRIAWIYGIIILIIFAIQLGPLVPFHKISRPLAEVVNLIAIFGMMLALPFWIGFVIHIFVFHISLHLVHGHLSRVYLLIPVLFYGSGVVAGAYSDIMAWNWKGKQEWISIEKSIPASVKFVTFGPYSLITNNRLPDPDGVFRPREVGFELAFISHARYHTEVRNEQLVLRSNRRPPCGHTFRTPEIGGRCFRKVYIARPKSFLVVGGRFGLERQSWSPPSYSWATLFHGSIPIVLHTNGYKERVGVLRGGTLRKNSYYLFPTIGCGLVRSNWRCDWGLFSRFRQETVGFQPGSLGSSSDTAAILMFALRKLRERTR